MPLNIDWQQILLHALNLSLLVGGLYALLFKPVKRYLDARSEKVETAAREEKRIVRDAQSEITELSLEATRKLVDCPVSDVYDQFLNSAEGSDAHGSAE